MSKVKDVLRLALPAVGEMILYMLIWVIDTAFVGRYGGSTAVSAVGFGSEIMYTTVNIFITIGIGVGITALVAQKVGAGKIQEAEVVLGQGILVGILTALALAIILGVFSKQILDLAGVEGEVLYQADRFMKIVVFGVFFNMVNSLLNSGLRGRGNTVIPLIASVIIVGVAVILDWILIFGRLGFKAYGVTGSAIATSVAYICGFIFLAIYYTFFSDFRIRISNITSINPYYIKRIVGLAVPSGLQEGAFSISRLLSLSFIMTLGEVQFASNQITTTIESISFMPGWGFAVAATALVGQRIGAGDYANAREYTKISALFSVGVMTLCAALFLIMPIVLMKLFISEAATIELGRLCLMVAAAEQPFMGMSMVYGGALKGSGDTRTPFIVSLLSNWAVRIPLLWLVIFVLKLNVVFVWVVTGIQWLFDGVLIWYLYKRKSGQWDLIL